MVSWSRKADPYRDETVYDAVMEAQAIWKQLPTFKKRLMKEKKQSYWDIAMKMVAERPDFRYVPDISGLKKAFYRGVRVHRSKNYKTRKTGRKKMGGYGILPGHWPDAVAEIIIFGLVEKALGEGNSLNQAYHLTAANESATINKKGRVIKPSPSSVRLVYQRMRKYYESKSSR